MTNYFPHDSNARNDEKLIRLRMRHKAAGYGVYFMILERLRDEKNYMCVKDYNIIAFDLREDAALVKSVVEDFGLFAFTEDGKYFYSESFLTRMQKKSDVKSKRAQAGKAGAKSRWKNSSKADEGTDGKHADAKQQELQFKDEGNKDADEQQPEEINYEKFLSYFNRCIRENDAKISPLKRFTESRIGLIQALIGKGYKPDDIVRVIRNATSSSKLNGRDKKSFIPDFDWIFKEDNFIRILEGSYNNK